MDNLINDLTHNIFLEILVLVICLDTIFGCGRAIKYKKWNSTVGIDGLIRKVFMIISLIILMMIDYIINFDFIGFIPDEIKQFINIKIGISSVFAILFILYEFTSVLKNMVKCGLPVPIKFKNKIEELLNKYTTELEDKK